ncbi:tRNA pseudouridine synthase B [Clostridium sp. CAG:354]|jgi:tRNA pseudouridine55 synthase|nr:tRNA pseudouridine(55) synthase TruB [Clostridium sp.]MEE0269567.1 tRNA pseudouridine(55) synthase TruB [Clostridia bacterium]CDE10517.1 tRNA pseudouridine synthase B [Clostridium sp. CAG:354]
MDGIIVINKEKEYTSHDVVAKLKKKLNISKVGHTGTLDPNATGVLPILIGKGTKFSKYLINHDKIYEVELELGKKTDTADIEGKVIEEKNVDEKYIKENLLQVLESFVGKQEQIPPMYSAIKKNGKKLYEYARAGEKVEIEPRKIEIYKIDLNKYDKNIISFVVSCSKGTYIRSLCEDIAGKLNTVGYMKNLKRLQVGKFNIKDAVYIDDIDLKNVNEHLITLEEILRETPCINLSEKKLKLFINGVQLTANNIDGLYKIYVANKFIGTGTIKKGLLKRDIIL